MNAREVIKIIEKDGWYLDRQKGSHRQYKHPQKEGTCDSCGSQNVG